MKDTVYTSKNGTKCVLEEVSVTSVDDVKAVMKDYPEAVLLWSHAGRFYSDNLRVSNGQVEMLKDENHRDIWVSWPEPLTIETIDWDGVNGSLLIAHPAPVDNNSDPEVWMDLICQLIDELQNIACYPTNQYQEGEALLMMDKIHQMMKDCGLTIGPVRKG